MIKKGLLVILTLFPAGIISAQYFQQRIDYTIKVTLIDSLRELDADLSLVYHNNSPDSLTCIWFHLWPNGYKNDSTALARQFINQKNPVFLNIPEKDRGYITTLDFKVNHQPVNWSYHPDYIDICKLELHTPLLPGEKVVITTPFKVKIPVVFSRLGHDGDAFYIQQWYPKPAVYDNRGWHTMPYLDQGEYYSEWGSFEVSITLPENYLVVATGVLQNDAEARNPTSSSALSSQQPQVIHNSTQNFPISSSQTKTLVYKQDSIHDFAWFADKRFLISQSSVTLPHSGRKVTTRAYRINRPENKLWNQAVQYVDSALYYYSLWNGDYPYDFCSAVEGVGSWEGMEYPMVTVIASVSNELELEDVIAHEVGHNWFYGILASNERVFPWMDEGINTFNELRYLNQRFGRTSPTGSEQYGLQRFPAFAGVSNLTNNDVFRLLYLLVARTNTDQPASLPAQEYTPANYNAIIYLKTAIAFNYLMNYLGPDLFDSCMQRYYNTWQFKHPYPEDLRKIFEETTGKDLSWFFDGLINSNQKLDYAATSIHPVKTENQLNLAEQSFGLTLKNKGGIAGPLSYSVLRNGEVQSTKWIDGFTGKKSFRIHCTDCDQVRIDAFKQMPELKRSNNTIRMKGIFKKMNPVKFRFLFGVEDEYKTEISYLPVAGWNNYDKWMPGLVIHNRALTDKNFEFSLMPLYSTGTGSISGSGIVDLKFFPHSAIFQGITLSASVSHFAYYRNKGNDLVKPYNLHYTAIPVSVQFRLKEGSALSPVKRQIVFRNISTMTDEWVFHSNGAAIENSYLNYQQAYFSLTQSRLFDPYSFNIALENGRHYSKAMAEIRYKISYHQPSKGVNFRLFAGAFIRNKEIVRNYKFRMSGWIGYQDYLFDNWFLGRTETKGVLSQQTELNEGGFKSFSYAGQSDQWLAALNLSFDLPWKLPIALFADAGIVPKEKTGTYEAETFYYDGGISLILIRNVLEVHIPLLRSNAIKEAQEINGMKFADQIRFVFSIRNFNIRNLKNSINPL